MKTLLTTGDVSKICKVSQKTVIKWFDEGLIDGYKIPGTKDRRISLKNLFDFIKLNNIPVSAVSSNFLEFYWEYFHHSSDECDDCIIYKYRIINCFKYDLDISREWFKCQSECKDCDYYIKYKDIENNDIE